MARLPYVDPESAPDEVRNILTRLPRPLNIFRLMAHAETMVWEPGAHASTFGGNPVSLAAAAETLRLLEDHYTANAATVGAFLKDRLMSEISAVPQVGDIRGLGLMIGIELDRACGELVGMALERGLIVNVTSDNVLRLVPPLVFNIEHADLLASTLVPLLREFTTGTPARTAA